MRRTHLYYGKKALLLSAWHMALAIRHSIMAELTQPFKLNASRNESKLPIQILKE